jgi:NAD(P)-dependent dehydrogenase (short-subunit alcohol dehydrogenase family)
MPDWTAAELPSFAGRTVIVTGANSGLGEVAAGELARVGAHVILAVRDTAKGAAAAERMTGPKTGQVEVRQLDLLDLSSVHRFADGIDNADVLINNAGIMASDYALTADGFERHIGTNHVGHFALTILLLPKLTDRVATVSSLLHNIGWSHTNLQGRSGRRLTDAVVLAADHVVSTDADFGARQTLYAVSQDLPGNTFVGRQFGLYGRTQPTWRSWLAKRATAAAALWELSEQLTDTKFPL